ncbi:regulatory protein RecX [Adlercreutzia sp. ZJ242]|uniref:regulatory protein RecX n=1 Tax=Adlercreutzia sp. ZJ242 TaxID=2709409 RepID=UPI0013ED3982|nr:RecX family transcriptional regulator [Adlercreutzia sp. ZJ242]
MSSKSSVIEQLRGSIAAIEGGGAGGERAPLPARSPKAARHPAGRVSFAAAASSLKPESPTGSEAAHVSSAEPSTLEEQADEAYQKVLRCVSVREQSTARMRDKLMRAGFAPEAADRAIERACRVGALDDVRYAEALVRATLAAGKGLRFAEAEIEELGIDVSALDAYRDHLDAGEGDEVARALAAIRARPPRAKNKREAAFRRCVAKGFSSDVATSAARIWCEEG